MTAFHLPTLLNVAPVCKNYSALDFMADIIIGVNTDPKFGEIINDPEVMTFNSDFLFDYWRYFVWPSFTTRPIQFDFLINSKKAKLTTRFLKTMTSMLSAYASSCTIL